MFNLLLFLTKIKIFWRKKSVSLKTVLFLRRGTSKHGAPGYLQKCYRVNPVVIMGCTIKMMINRTLLTKRCFFVHIPSGINFCNTFLMIHFPSNLLCSSNFAIQTQTKEKITNFPTFSSPLPSFAAAAPFTVSFVEITVPKNIFIFNHPEFKFI